MEGLENPSGYDQQTGLHVVSPNHQFLYLQVLCDTGSPLPPALFNKEVVAGMFISQNMTGTAPETPLDILFVGDTEAVIELEETANMCHQYYYSPGFNKVTLQSTHWSIQTLSISVGDSSCSWVFYSCTGPKCGVGVDLVDCNAVGGGHVATSIDQSVGISACGALALEEYKQAASVQPLLCNS